ncbi:hypothetical protein [Streptomyces phaeofaciens]|uniref:hypothetical protein n=1 Tax=Streptomyces phaeofaciens TaxID=68254 RepID=UPI0027E4088C|nr:hypothetical protein [Streptomyces phaeofaciens]
MTGPHQPAQLGRVSSLAFASCRPDGERTHVRFARTSRILAGLGGGHAGRTW